MAETTTEAKAVASGGDPTMMIAAEGQKELDGFMASLQGGPQSIKSAAQYVLLAAQAAAKELPAAAAAKFLAHYLAKAALFSRPGQEGHEDYCRKTGCDLYIPALGDFSTWDTRAAGSGMATTMYNFVTQKQYLGLSPAYGHRVKAAVYRVYGNTARAAVEAALAGQTPEGNAMASTIEQAKASAALQLIGRVGEESDVIISMARNQRNADGSYAGAGQMVLLPGLTAADLPKYNKGWQEELEKIRTTYDSATWKSYAYLAKKRRLLEGGYPDPALVASMYQTSELARERQAGDTALQAKLAELARIKAGEAAAAAAAAGAVEVTPSNRWTVLQMILAGLAVVIVIGGVVYVVKK